MVLVISLLLFLFGYYHRFTLPYAHALRFSWAISTIHHLTRMSNPSFPYITASSTPSGVSLIPSHAGCYCLLDIQQLATSLITHADLAISILARVVSSYPDRKEAMCDAGALSVSKDTGPLAGYGHVVYPEHLKSWDLGRVSQEHGTLVRRPDSDSDSGGGGGGGAREVKEGEGEEPEIGGLVRIVPQHACLACACYPWFYVVEDEGDEVVDVWVPCKGW